MCRKEPVGVKAFREGSTTTIISAATTRPHFSVFDLIGRIISVQTPAAAGKKPARFPLQKENDRHQDDNFSGHGRSRGLLQHLIGRADAEGGTNRAHDTADASED